MSYQKIDLCLMMFTVVIASYFMQLIVLALCHYIYLEDSKVREEWPANWGHVPACLIIVRKG